MVGGRWDASMRKRLQEACRADVRSGRFFRRMSAPVVTRVRFRGAPTPRTPERKHIWAPSANVANDVARIREGGEVLEHIDLAHPCFATMLRGPDRTPLFMLTADCHGTEGINNVIRARTGRVRVVDAPAPASAGREADTDHSARDG